MLQNAVVNRGGILTTFDEQCKALSMYWQYILNHEDCQQFVGINENYEFNDVVLIELIKPTYNAAYVVVICKAR